MMTVVEGLPKGHENAAATLYREAFGQKLGKLLGPERHALKFFSSTINPQTILAAFSGETLLGVSVVRFFGTKGGLN